MYMYTYIENRTNLDGEGVLPFIQMIYVIVSAYLASYPCTYMVYVHICK